MRYAIKIHYQTGDSFGSEDTTGEVGCSWTDIDKAKEALQAISEHYRARNDFSRVMSSGEEKFFKELKAKKWFDTSKDSRWMWQHCLHVEKDDGTLQQISAFWCGYFERLHSAEIIVDGDTDMKVTF
jgi:hypothetical protein